MDNSEARLAMVVSYVYGSKVFVTYLKKGLYIIARYTILYTSSRDASKAEKRNP